MASCDRVLFLFVFLTAAVLTDVAKANETPDCSPDDPTCMEQGDDPCAGGHCEEEHTCPPDSYLVMDGTNSTSCACKPCPTGVERCKSPLKLKLIRSASRDPQPGACCDHYECTLREVCRSYGERNDQEGATWMKDACTRCVCRGGYSFCEQIAECHPQPSYEHFALGGPAGADEDHEAGEGDGPSGCLALGSLRQNGDKWREGPCTECACERGHKKCTTPQCKSDCERPTVLLAGECCPVCPPPCPPVPECGGPGRQLSCSAPDLFECSRCTCEPAHQHLPAQPPLPPPTVESPPPTLPPPTAESDFTTLAVVAVLASTLLGCCIAAYYVYHARRSRGRRIVNNPHTVCDEKLSLFDVKLRPADSQQIYRQLGTNHVDHV